MKGFDLLDLIRKLWAKEGTASYPLVFVDRENGSVYEPVGTMNTDQDNKLTVIDIRLHGS